MINIIGLGYIGLPTSLMLASHGMNVVGTDCNKELIELLQNGQTTFEENGLSELFADAVQAGITFSSEYQKTNLYIVTVPTPYDDRTKKIDPTYVVSAVEKVTEVCQNETIIVIESTVSPGTIDRYIRPIINEINEKKGKKIEVAHAPERIIPGNMIKELYDNNRTIGSDSKNVGITLKKVYGSFCKGEIILTDIRTAEMTKVVENTFRDINIAFANELAKICYSDGLDVHEIIRIANKHPRVNILSPGPGVGGHCIPVDPWFLVGDYPRLTNLILSARQVNDSMPEYVLERVSYLMKENNLTDISRIGIYGMTYKANIDDVRESPTLQLLESMNKHLASEIKVYDPYVKKTISSNQYHNLDSFLNDIDLVIIMVEHDEIKNNIKKLNGKIVFDTRNISNLESTNKL